MPGRGEERRGGASGSEEKRGRQREGDGRKVRTPLRQFLPTPLPIPSSMSTFIHLMAVRTKQHFKAFYLGCRQDSRTSETVSLRQFDGVVQDHTGR